MAHENMTNANFPMDPEGRTMHLNVKAGDVAHRIISVGSTGRAEKLASYLNDVRVVHSSRGFVTHTGTFENTPVTVIATGMGIAMIDFVVRELRAVVDASPANPMYIIRLGTCGTVSSEIPVGSVAVASKGSICVRRNPDAFESSSTDEPYIFNRPVACDEQISKAIFEEYAADANIKDRVVPCMNCTADSFYSSQGRSDNHFDDRNQTLIDAVVAKYPDVATLEMETFHLFDLARCALPAGTIRASASTIILAQRRSNVFIDPATYEMLEAACGRAVLKALVHAK